MERSHLWPMEGIPYCITCPASLIWRVTTIVDVWHLYPPTTLCSRNTQHTRPCHTLLQVECQNNRLPWH